MASSRENAGRQLYSGNSNQGSITSPVNIAPSLFHNKTPSKQRFNLYHFLYIFENCSNVLLDYESANILHSKSDRTT